LTVQRVTIPVYQIAAAGRRRSAGRLSLRRNLCFRSTQSGGASRDQGVVFLLRLRRQQDPQGINPDGRAEGNIEQ